MYQEDKIILENINDGDIFNCSIVLLKGQIVNVENRKTLYIYLNKILQIGTKTEYYDSHNKILHFKCILDLKQNENELLFDYSNNLSSNINNYEFQEEDSVDSLPYNLSEGSQFIVENLLREEKCDHKHEDLNNCPEFSHLNDINEEFYCDSNTHKQNMTLPNENNTQNINKNLKLIKSNNNVKYRNNNININSHLQIKKIIIFYVVRVTKLVITPVYIVPNNHNGRFQAPFNYDNSIENACKKIMIGLKLIQCLMIEKLMKAKTFQIQSELCVSNNENTDKNPCIVFHSELTIEEVNKLSQEQLWEHIGRELMMSPYGSSNKKFVAFLSCTQWNGQFVESHAAIGGGGLALFGTGCLYTWPSFVNEVVSCFLNNTLVDTKYLMDDSCNRGTYGGCFSTTLGSVCHEIGHALDLGHTKDGIMSRGFDYINYVFVIKDNYDNDNDDEFLDNKTPTMYNMNKDLRNININILNNSSTLQYQDNKKGTRSNNRINNNNNIICVDFHQLNMNTESDNTCDKKHKKLTSEQTEDSGYLFCDKTFWSENCAILLQYHRWLNSYENVEGLKNCSNLKYDARRNTITSNVGIKLIELRGQKGLCFHYWKFLESTRKCFIIPVQYMKFTLCIVAIDELGSLIKVESKR